MKKYLVIAGIVMSLILSSCQQLTWTLARFMGVRKPKVESKETVFKFLDKIGQDTTDVYALDTNLYNLFRNEPFKPDWDTGLRPIQIRVYDHAGEPVMQWASCEGYLDDLKTFDSLPPRNYNGLNTSLKLQEDINRYYTLEGSPANLFAPEGYDYYVLIYFANWFPRQSKESFSIIDQYVIDHPGLKFKIYKINMDVLDFWGYDDVITEESNFE